MLRRILSTPLELLQLLFWRIFGSFLQGSEEDK